MRMLKACSLGGGSNGEWCARDDDERVTAHGGDPVHMGIRTPTMRTYSKGNDF